jgi:hypothetical protein
LVIASLETPGSSAAFIDTDTVNEERFAANAAVPAGFAGSLAADRFISKLGRNKTPATAASAITKLIRSVSLHMFFSRRMQEGGTTGGGIRPR